VDDPGTLVNKWLINPPVHDSAAAKRNPCLINNSPTSNSSGLSNTSLHFYPRNKPVRWVGAIIQHPAVGASLRVIEYSWTAP
jgi:hypothetical protein